MIDNITIFNESKRNLPKSRGLLVKYVRKIISTYSIINIDNMYQAEQFIVENIDKCRECIRSYLYLIANVTLYHSILPYLHLILILNTARGYNFNILLLLQ